LISVKHLVNLLVKKVSKQEVEPFKMKIMKTRMFFLISALTVVMTACTTSRMADAQVNVALYSRIPMAPDVVVTIETPVIVAPGPDYVWIDGYWAWDYNYREYVWVQSHWELAPYAGAYWIPGYWEYYRNRYRWVAACWLPRDYVIHYGYCTNRYDYYGRPVYYPRPRADVHVGYAYAYDHRPEYRTQGYSSARAFNDEPRSVRDRINREYNSVSGSSRTATTSRNTQGEIRVRDGSSRTSAASNNANTSGSRTGITSGSGNTGRDATSGNGSSRTSTSRTSSTDRTSEGSTRYDTGSSRLGSNSGSDAATTRSTSTDRSDSNSTTNRPNTSTSRTNGNSGSSRTSASPTSSSSSSRSSSGSSPTSSASSSRSSGGGTVAASRNGGSSSASSSGSGSSRSGSSSSSGRR
jgi:hypothetical protein